MSSERLNTFHDASGLVTVSVFRQVAPSAQQRFTDQAAEVPNDMIVIGGGANTQCESPGALLTASYPNDQLTAWLASSKDHGDPAPHVLITYAIGLSIQGLTRTDLLSHVRVTSVDSGLAAHPQASALVTDSGFLLVSGGFRVDWTGGGNLATASFPSSNFAWTARSKDHFFSDPSNIRVFAIALRETLPVGTVAVAIGTQDSAVANHPRSTANVVQGFAMTGGGADVHWAGNGNLLWLLEPSVGTTLQAFSAASKDHMAADPCSLTAYSVGIKITPGGTTTASAIDTYIGTLGHLPSVTAVPVSPVGPRNTTTLNVGWDAIEQRMQGTAVYDEAVMFGTDQSVIWPGSVLQGGHVLDAAPAPVPLRRNGLTITVTGLMTKAGVSASRSVAMANTGSVTDAMNALLSQNFGGPDPTPADIDAHIYQVYSVEHACQQLGISVHYLSTDIKAQMSHSFQEKKASFVANVTQKYFNISASDPGPGNSYFDPQVTPAEASPYMSQGNPPLYVSSIAFGRRLLLMMLTDTREENFDLDISAATTSINANASGNAHVGMSSLLLQSSSFLLEIGGAVNATLLSAAPGDKSAIQAIIDYIANGAKWSPTSPGSPIGWTLRYVDDAVGFRAADALDYNTLAFKRKCFPNTIIVNQDNSGFPNDRDEDHVIPAPDGTRIDINSVTVAPQVYRGAAHITSVIKQPEAITVRIWTQAAGGFPFGHHSGGVDVTVNFTACGA